MMLLTDVHIVNLNFVRSCAKLLEFMTTAW